MKLIFTVLSILILFSAFPLFAQSPNGLSTRDKLNLIFQPDMIGSTIAYLEHQIGPAKRIDNFPVNDAGDLQREYRIGPCTVNVYGQSNISSLELINLSQECSFDLAPFLGSEGSQEAFGTTFIFCAPWKGAFT
jgi:hypothetical protein